MTGLRERKMAHTRSTIAIAAWTLFQQRGVAGVSMREIAELADVAEKTVHNYFPGKSELVVAALDVANPSEEYVGILAGRPAGEHPVTAFRRAVVEAHAGLTDKDARQASKVYRVIRQDPVMHGVYACRLEAAADHLAGMLRERAERAGMTPLELDLACAQCVTAMDVVGRSQPVMPTVTTWLEQLDEALRRVEAGWLA